MWFAWDGSVIRFTHTDERQKFRNLAVNANVSVSIQDPENPYRYLELRGVIEKIIPDPGGAFYLTLAQRYGRDRVDPPVDAAHRVVLEMVINHVGKR
jgi:PPOX class probable F420-dependent enzyme